MINLREIVEEKIISFVNKKNITCGNLKYWETPLVAIADEADPMFQELRNTVCEDHKRVLRKIRNYYYQR